MSAVPPRHADARVQRVIERFESLGPADVERLGELYTADARFKDPFNDVQGLPAVQRVFRHMFEVLVQPRFVVLEALLDGDRCFLTWDFHFAPRGRPPMRVHGGSLLRFAADGRVREHVDYWDAAHELYAKLPLLGGLMRWLKRRLATP